MEIVEREFRATQPIHGETTAPPPASARLLHRRPQNWLHVVAILARSEMTLALMMPVLCGSALAWWQSTLPPQSQISVASPNVVGFCMLLFGVVVTGWCYNIFSETIDYQRSLKPNVRSAGEIGYTGFSLLHGNYITPGQVKGLGSILVAVAFSCSLWLVMLAGWPMLFFIGVGFLTICVLLFLPAKYGYKGWGLQEVGIFLSFGLVQVVAAYYVQTQTLSWLLLWVSIPCSLLPVLVFFNSDGIFQRRDWLINKRTLTVNLGPTRALDVGVSLVITIYVAILLVVSLTDLPLLALMGLASLPVALGAFARIDRSDPSIDDAILLYHSSISAATLTGLLFSAALLVDRLV